MSGKLKVPKFHTAKADDPIYKKGNQVFTPAPKPSHITTLSDTSSSMKKPSSPKPIRVMDEQDQVWSSINNLVVGLSPEERAVKLSAFVDSLPAHNPNKE